MVLNLSSIRTVRFYPLEMLLVLIILEAAESNPGP